MALPQFQCLVQHVLSSRAKIDNNSEANGLSELASTLSLLFEASHILHNKLVPELSYQLRTAVKQPDSYSDLIDMALRIVNSWDWSDKAEFIGGHPRIGEVKALSNMSAAEQGQTSIATPTPADVLERLAFLNSVYERRYPGLVYITFVNGRTRAQIRDEMEEKLTLEGLIPVVCEDHKNGIELEKIVPYDINNDLWRREVERAVYDVGRIAKSRLEKLGYS